MSSRERLLAMAGLALLAFVLLAAWARFSSPAAWEPAVLFALAISSDPWGDVVRLVNFVGSLQIWAVVVGASALAVGIRRGVAAGALIALSFAADLAAFAVKIVVERERPETAATEHFFGPDSFAFPSGHVVRAVAFAAVVAWLLAPAGVRARLALASAVLAGLVMGYARVALGVHWPTDALGGILLGVGWFGVTAALVRRAA